MKSYNIQAVSLEYYSVKDQYLVFIDYTKDGISQLFKLAINAEQVMGMGQISSMQYISERATAAVGDPDFYEAMREYFIKGTDFGKYEPFGFVNESAKGFMPVKKSYDPAKLDYVYSPNSVKTSVGIKLIQGATEAVSDSGPDMMQIDALPGIHNKVKHPVDGNMGSIKNIIINLNDKHKWSREQVADWLETLDVDLTFKSPDAILKEQQRKDLENKITILRKNIDAVTESLKKMNIEFEQATLKMIELEATLNE